MIFGIFRRNNIFIDENVLSQCQHKIREYYPIREKHNKFAILVMKIATFTVRLAYNNTPIPLDGVSATFRNFGQNDTKRGRNAKSAVETYRKLHDHHLAT